MFKKNSFTQQNAMYSQKKFGYQLQHVTKNYSFNPLKNFYITNSGH